MNKSDRIRLFHIRDWSKEIIEMAAGRDRNDLDNDRMFLNAALRCIEVIGEASSRITPDTRNQYPQIPWSSMIAMRNRLIHAYFDIQTDIVWKTIVVELPQLLETVEAILKEEIDH